MVRARDVEKLSDEEVNRYLGSLRSKSDAIADDEPVGEDALDDYLLARTAEQLRAASERLKKLEQEL